MKFLFYFIDFKFIRLSAKKVDDILVVKANLDKLCLGPSSNDEDDDSFDDEE